MDAKTLQVLEYPKIRERLKSFCDFSASMESGACDSNRPIRMTSPLPASPRRPKRASYFPVQDIGIGGAHDIRPAVDLAARGGVLDPQQLLDVKSTLISCRELKKTFERKTDEYPRLSQIADGLPEFTRNRGRDHTRPLRARRSAGFCLPETRHACGARSRSRTTD